MIRRLLWVSSSCTLDRRSSPADGLIPSDFRHRVNQAIGDVRSWTAGLDACAASTGVSCPPSQTPRIAPSAIGSTAKV